jgi:N-sulfoglucosamine sulfohydrolase
MHEDVPKLPNALKEIGYRTGIIGKTHFEPFASFQWDVVETNDKKVILDRDVRWMNQQAAKFFDAQPPEAPFFLVMSYVDPHRGGGDGRYGADKNEKFPRMRGGLPENPPSPDQTTPIPFLGVDSPDVRREDSDFYSAVDRLDAGVGGFLDLLKERGLDGENTLVVFLGDNGPDVTRGKAAAYATATRTPLLIRWPGHDHPGLTRDELVSSTDLFPTFLAAAGADNPTIDPRQNGLSLLPLLEPGKPAWRDMLFTEFLTHVPWHFFPRYTVFDGKYHLIHNLDGGRLENPLDPENYCYAWWEAQSPKYEGKPIRKVYDHVENPPEFELFDVSADPSEFHNLADDPAQKELVARLAARIAQWRKKTADPFLEPGFEKAFREKVAEMKREYDRSHGKAEGK